LPQNPEHVRTENLLDLVSGVPTIQQGLGNLWIVRHGIDSRRHAIGSIEVRTKANVIDSGNFHNVVDVVDQRLQWRARNRIFGKPLEIKTLRVFRTES